MENDRKYGVVRGNPEEESWNEQIATDSGKGDNAMFSKQRITTPSHGVYFRYWLLTLSWMLLISTCRTNAAKILILPGCTYSCCRALAGIGEELTQHNHNVSIYVIEILEFSKCTQSTEMNRITFSSQAAVDLDNLIKSVVGSVSEKSAFANMLNLLKGISGIVNGTCRTLLGDATFIDKLRDEHFDIVIVDGLAYPCFYVLPYLFNIPYISVSNQYFNFITGQPFVPSIYPFLALEYTDKMTLIQRTLNAIVCVVFSLVPPMFIPMDVIHKIMPHMTARDVCNLASKSELFLENKDHLLDFAKPLPDGHIMVGGLTATPPKPLPQDLQIFMDDAKDGVVIISFGSILAPPPYSMEKLSHSLKKHSAAILWKRPGKPEIRNIKFVNWFPQNDVLGHRNVKLFISHCGNNGMYEALFHGVPILCVPIMHDQFANAAIVKARRYGLTANLFRDSQDDVDNVLSEMMTNRIYGDNIKLASKIFHSREHGPRQRAVFWIEHVIKYGGQHLRSRAMDIPSYQYMNVDIYAVVASVVFIIAYICYRMIYLMIASCYGTIMTGKIKQE